MWILKIEIKQIISRHTLISDIFILPNKKKYQHNYQKYITQDQNDYDL